MSWMDDGGFSMQAFRTSDLPMARMSFRTSTGQFDITLSKTDVQRIRRECGKTIKELDQLKGETE